MRIPDEMRKCAVFLAIKDDRENLKFKGTAFCYSFHPPESIGGDVYPYLVTAKHNVVGALNRSADGKLHLRVNLKNGGNEIIETDYSDWSFHPDEDVDVAVLPMEELKSSGQEAEFFFVDSRVRVTPQSIRMEGIGVGDDTFVIGLFTHHAGEGRNIPIVRVGNIAAMPEEKVQSATTRIDAYLVEVRSLGGLSGSPVFVSLGPVRPSFYEQAVGEVQLGYRFAFLGLIHGHWELTQSQLDTYAEDSAHVEKINQGIAMVVPADKIMEVLQLSELADNLAEYAKRMRAGNPRAED